MRFANFKNHTLIHVRMWFSLIFGRIDLRIGASEAKFDDRLDFEVHLPPAPQKLWKFYEKLISQTRKNPFLDFFETENEALGIV